VPSAAAEAPPTAATQSSMVVPAVSAVSQTTMAVGVYIIHCT